MDKAYNPSGWWLLTEYIDTYEIGDIITRKDILNHFRKEDHAMVIFSIPTIDKYRCWLVAAGYLANDKRGSYKVLKTIGGLTSNLCERLGYPKRFEN